MHESCPRRRAGAHACANELVSLLLLLFFRFWLHGKRNSFGFCGGVRGRRVLSQHVFYLPDNGVICVRLCLCLSRC